MVRLLSLSYYNNKNRFLLYVQRYNFFMNGQKGGEDFIV